MRLIDADALLEALKDNDINDWFSKDFLFETITNAPTVQREGWVSVPIEPTEGMIVAGRAQGRDNELAFRHRVEGTVLIYKAMLQAAPTDTE